MGSGVAWGVALVLGAAVVLASGFRLSRLGAPYGSALLNVHKLVDLAAVVVVGFAIYRHNLVAALSTSEWIIVGLAAFLSWRRSQPVESPAEPSRRRRGS